MFLEYLTPGQLEIKRVRKPIIIIIIIIIIMNTD